MGKKNNGCYYIIFQTTVAVIASVTYQAVLKKKCSAWVRHGSEFARPWGSSVKPTILIMIVINITGHDCFVHKFCVHPLSLCNGPLFYT